MFNCHTGIRNPRKWRYENKKYCNYGHVKMKAIVKITKIKLHLLENNPQKSGKIFIKIKVYFRTTLFWCQLSKYMNNMCICTLYCSSN